MNMRKKPRVNFEKYFVKADRGALRLLQRMLAFDPVERPTCEEALAGSSSSFDAETMHMLLKVCL